MSLRIGWSSRTTCQSALGAPLPSRTPLIGPQRATMGCSFGPPASVRIAESRPILAKRNKKKPDRKRSVVDLLMLVSKPGLLIFFNDSIRWQGPRQIQFYDLGFKNPLARGERRRKRQANSLQSVLVRLARPTTTARSGLEWWLRS